MLSTLLEITEHRFLIPLLLIVAATALAKGVFGMHRFRSQDRKEFLGLWASRKSSDDLWMEVAIRHQFGEFLPASLIRSLMSAPQAGRALLDVSTIWGLLDQNDETGEVHWRKKRHSERMWRGIERHLLNIGYFLSMGAALLLGYLVVKAPDGDAFSFGTLWVLVIMLVIFAFVALAKAEVLRTAEEAAPRWLGLK